MVRSAPYSSSSASPRTCADECQYSSLPSGSSKPKSLREQSPSRGLRMSQSWPSTWARRDPCASFLWMPMAMSQGEVTNLMPSLMAPSGMTTLMGSFLDLASSTLAPSRSKYFSKSSMRLA